MNQDAKDFGRLKFGKIIMSLLLKMRYISHDRHGLTGSTIHKDICGCDYTSSHFLIAEQTKALAEATVKLLFKLEIAT